MTKENKITLHVCRTGEKEQYYTLYEEGIVYSTYSTARFCNYVQNLSFKKDVALAKAQVQAALHTTHGFFGNIEIEYHESPRMIYTTMEAFGAIFKTSKSGTTMWANATPEFWEYWKADKMAIKNAGFWVKKINYSWLVFCRNDAEYDYS